MDWLTTRPGSDEVLDAFTIISLIVFGIVLVAAGFYSARPWAPPFGAPFSKHFVRRSATLLGWPAGIGLFFVIIRIVQIDPATFGRPIWIVFSWVALIAAAVYVGMRAPQDREMKRRNKAGIRRSQLDRRPVRKRGVA
jgi:hypothetical protein